MNIVICGDTFPTTENYKYFKGTRVRKCFDKEILDYIYKADYSICNLEGALTDSKRKIKKSGPALRAPIKCINGIKELGFKCVCLANNHVMDFGSEGLSDTINALESAGIQWVGTGNNRTCLKKYTCLEKNDVKVIIYNVAEVEFNIPQDNYPGCNIWDDYETYKDIEELKNISDHVIVVYHGGVEEFRYPTPIVRKRCCNMVESGASIVLTQHSHCIGVEERYKNGYCLYGQGNFSFGINNDDYSGSGILLELQINKKTYNINKHLIQLKHGRSIYAKNQDFSDFLLRSDILNDKEKYKKLFLQFCYERMINDLEVLIGKNIYNRIIKKILPKKIYYNYIRKMYNNRNIYTVINSFRCSDHREIIINGFLQLDNR